MQILISYEVDTKQSAVRDIMRLKGYEAVWTKDSIEYVLPETSLWKPDTSPAQAMEDLKKIVRALNIRLLGASVVEFTDLSAVKVGYHAR